MTNDFECICPKCHKNLKLDLQNQKCICEDCKLEFNLSDFNKSNDKLDTFICNNCNEQIIFNSKLKICPNCTTTNLEKSQLSNISIDYIVPFKYDKKMAIDIYNELKAGNLLVLHAFRKRKNINNIIGMYIPFLAFDYSVDGSIDTTSKKITKFKCGNYDYTKTDVFSCIREANIDLKKVLISNSKIVDEENIKFILPYNYDDIKTYVSSDLNEYALEKFALDKDKLLPKANDVARQNFIDAIKDDMKDYSDIQVINDNIKLRVSDMKTILLPFWILNVKCKGKIYKFIINGQTGKIYGNVVAKKSKIIFIFVISFLITFLIIYFIYVGVCK